MRLCGNFVVHSPDGVAAACPIDIYQERPWTLSQSLFGAEYRLVTPQRSAFNMAMSTVVLLLLLVTGWVTVDSAAIPPVTDCSEQIDHGKQGTVHHYEYSTTAEAAAIGTTNRLAGLHFKCLVDLVVLGQCRYIMKVQQCDFSETPSGDQHEYNRHETKSTEFSAHMSRHSLLFVMSQGDVKGLIASKDEPEFVLNIKRGIISSLQGAQAGHTNGKYELVTDVHGTCPVKRDSAEASSTSTEKKMAACHFPSRPDWRLSPFSVFWNMSFVQLWAMNSTARCKYQLADNNKLVEAVCHERHAIKLESHLDTTVAVQTNIFQVMKERGEYWSADWRDTFKEDITAFDTNLKNRRVAGIVFVWEPKPEPTVMPDNFLVRANKFMEDMVQTTELDISVVTIDMFDKLVLLLRGSPDVSPFAQGVYKCKFQSKCTDFEQERAEAYLKDALVTCHTIPCMKAFIQIAMNGQMSDNYFNYVLYTATKAKITDADYVAGLLEICKAKPTRTCLLSLSSVVHTFFLNNRDKMENKEVPKPIKDSVEFFSKMIGEDCNADNVLPELSYHQRVERIILALKAFGNLGEIAQRSTPALLERLQKCATGRFLPHNVTLEAVKAFRRMKSIDQMYGWMIDILKDKSASIEHRIAAYLVIVSHYQDTRLFKELVNIVRKETNYQIGNFVTMHMNSLLTHSDPSLAELEKSMQEVMSEYPDVFVVRGTHPLTSSRFREFGRFFELPMVKDAISRFGIDVSSMALYETFSFLPQELMLNLTTQLFGRTFNLATLGANIHGFDATLEALVGPNGIINDYASIQDMLRKMPEQEDIWARLQDPIAFIDSDYEPHFKSDVEAHLDKLHKSVVSDYKKTIPSGHFSFKLFGDELGFTSLKFMNERMMHFFEETVPAIQWHEPMKYHSSHIIRFIEGHNQIPTLIGLPLYWSTNATLAFSIRANIKIDPTLLLQTPRGLDVKWKIEPSWAVAFQNQMVLDVPYFTNIGIESYTTAYRSREHAGEIKYKEGELMIKLKVPQRPQQILNCSRVNHLIIGENHEDIPDYDIERVTVEGCTPGDFLGVKYCRMKSYANVTHRLKPWFLMAGNAYYRLWSERKDPALKEYILSIKRDTANPLKNYKISFKAPDTHQRDVDAEWERNPETHEFSLKVSMPDKPHFKIDARRVRTLEQNSVRYDARLEAMFQPGRPILFEAHKRTSSESSQPFGPDKKAKVLMTMITIAAKADLPDSMYKWERSYRSYGENTELEHTLSYESKQPKSYMHEILPDIFWESDRKAKVYLYSRILSQSESDEFQQTSVSFIKAPKAQLQLDTARIEKSNQHQSIHFNLTKFSLPGHNMESFINVTYDMTNSETSDRTIRDHVVKLSIPHTRWTVAVHRNFDSVDNKNLFTIRREKTQDGSLEVKDTSSDLKTWEVSLRADHHNTTQETGLSYPEPRERTMDIVLTYPRDGQTHTITYKGHYISDEAKRNMDVSFQNEHDLHGSYYQLHWHGKTVYSRRAVEINLEHECKLEHKPTKKEYTYSVNLVTAPETSSIDFTQKFRSAVYTFDETLTLRQDGANTKVLNLEIKSHSPVWDGLNVELKQEFNFDPENGWEKMTFRHKLIDIDVKADFKYPIFRWYQKEFLIKSKNNIIPNMKWTLDYHDYNYYSARIDYPDDGHSIFAVFKIDPGHKGGAMTISQEGEDTNGNQTVMNYMVRIIPPSRIVTNYSVDTKAVHKAAQVYATRFAKMWEAWKHIKSDPNHPMNNLLRPIVKTTLAEFQAKMIESCQERRQAFRQAIVEAVKSFEPIIKPAIMIIQNVLTFTERKLESLDGMKPQYDSLTVWMWNYFDVPSRLRMRIEQITQTLTSKLGSLSEDSRFGSRIIDHPFIINSFSEMPMPTPKLYRQVYQVKDKLAEVRGHEWKRIAVAYGDHNMVTFDGKGYRISSFPSKDCSYLLAHDFAYRKYSIIRQEEELHFLFQELAVSIDSVGDITINGTKKVQDFPIYSWNDKISVTVQHDKVIHINTKYGLNVVCSIPAYSCLFSLNFWNHNRTLGLLGNNDNEPLNDFLRPDGTITTDIGEFIAPYSLSSKAECKSPSEINKKPPTCDTHPDRLCDFWFNKNNFISPFFRCFDQVDPEPFQQNCATDTACGKNACDSAIAYTALCSAYDIAIDSPAQCSKLSCPAWNAQVGTSWTEKDGGEKHVEIIVVVEESKANLKAGSSLKGLESLVEQVNRAFKKTGYTSIKFGLVGYGLPKAHIHTINGKQKATFEELVGVGLKSLKFTAEGDHFNALPAVELAATGYMFHAKAERIVLLISPKDKELGRSESKAIYPTLKKLEKNGFTLYSFSSYGIAPRNKKIFGTRYDGYVIPHIKKGDRPTHVDYPTELYAKLAAGTQGAVFHIGFVEDNDTPKFFNEVSDEILKKAVKDAARCKSCQCVSVDSLVARAECKLTEC